MTRQSDQPEQTRTDEQEVAAGGSAATPFAAVAGVALVVATVVTLVVALVVLVLVLLLR